MLTTQCRIVLYDSIQGQGVVVHSYDAVAVIYIIKINLLNLST